MPFYAVAKGVKPGVYTEWSECQKQTQGFRGPQFKKFNTREEAEAFIQERVGNVVDKRKKEDSQAKEKDSADVGGKRKVTEDDDDSSNSGESKRAKIDDGDGYQSAIKKRVLTRPIPDKKNFEVDESGSVVVYTDGCCWSNGKNGARAGVGVYFGADNTMNVSEPVRGRATNNTAEIQAMTYALELIKRAGFTKAVINTDSQFVINCMTSWMSGWKKKGWKKADGSEVINKSDLMDLDRASDGLMVKYNYVKGHSGLTGNEEADRLAKAGAKDFDENITE